MTLMRLRVVLSGQDLGHRFGVHQSTVSCVFTIVIDMLFKRLKHLIVWPERDILKKTLPMHFRKHYPNCTVIIDCITMYDFVVITKTLLYYCMTLLYTVL